MPSTPRDLIPEEFAGNEWLVEEGLNAGDRLITEGLQYVKPGVEVKVKEASNVKPAQPTQASAASAGAKGE